MIREPIKIFVFLKFILQTILSVLTPFSTKIKWGMIQFRYHEFLVCLEGQKTINIFQYQKKVLRQLYKCNFTIILMSRVSWTIRTPRELGPPCCSLNWSYLADKEVPIARMSQFCRTIGTTLPYY